MLFIKLKPNKLGACKMNTIYKLTWKNEAGQPCGSRSFRNEKDAVQTANKIRGIEIFHEVKVTEEAC
jgi:hypothetical protein